ncbi:hypothetical protein BWD10_08795 [Neisseria zoodegmatis]|uniref:Uncharacterized protein n=2 Tax=Neisseria zoodegmatis TaxID=326523 RepID=A0ABX3WCG7_9NEIS|nr:hypothetical protein BWD10_08795 [Neisseria zoodegmatis]
MFKGNEMSDIQQHQNNVYPANQNTAAPVVSLKEWILTLLVLAIPFVNIIMLLVWAFGSSTNPNKANFCKAQIVMMLLGIVLALILIFVVGLTVPTMQQGM